MAEAEVNQSPTPVQPSDRAFSLLKPEIAALKSIAGVENVKPRSQKHYPITFIVGIFLSEQQSRIDTPAISLTVCVDEHYPESPATFEMDAPFPKIISNRLLEHIGFHAIQLSEKQEVHVVSSIQWFISKMEDILMSEFRDALESYLADSPDGSQQRRFAIQTEAVIIAPPPLFEPKTRHGKGGSKQKATRSKETKQPKAAESKVQKSHPTEPPQGPNQEAPKETIIHKQPNEKDVTIQETSPALPDSLNPTFDAETRTVRDDEVLQCMKRFGSSLVYEKSTPRPDGVGEDYHFFVNIAPSDPDFSFEFSSVRLHVILPLKYPMEEDPVVTVVEENMSQVVRDELSGKILERINDTRSSSATAIRLRRLFTWFDNNMNELLQVAYTNEIQGRDLLSSMEAVNLEREGEQHQDSSEFSGDDSYEGSEDEDEYYEDSEDDDLPENENRDQPPLNDPKTGIPIVLNGMKLEGISVLQCLILNLQVICNRCQSKYDISLSGTTSQSKFVQCGKCHYPATARFLPKLAHANDSCIGNIDQLYNMSIFDVLPSSFRGSCLECPKVSIKVPDMLAGRHFSRVCHECHKTMSFTFEKATVGIIKSQLTGEDAPPPEAKAGLQRKRIPKDSSLKVGTPLPKNGTCKHYSQSYRWLRFPCCGKAFPCDDCHNEESDHIAEWATRMICGNCSRESSYYANKICVCGQQFGKVGSKAHWEGGHGCRDRSRMSRKDPKKFSGYGKTQSRKSRKPS
eukprot:TRINITY_DN10737_c0_g1_i1.p1 TRINITY_DN10737_c0_g1~~TRINITY_DN10737_c0_g1_i1.p1  ORF type:complete len:742 (+),score=125.05 TRINITY_DN10737_c0_g1_i1:92-2317(+)